MAVKFPPFLAFQKPSTYSDKKDILLKKGIKKRAFCGPFRIIWLNLLRYFEFAPVGHEEQDAGDDAEDPAEDDRENGWGDDPGLGDGSLVFGGREDLDDEVNQADGKGNPEHDLNESHASIDFNRIGVSWAVPRRWLRQIEPGKSRHGRASQKDGIDDIENESGFSRDKPPRSTGQL